MFKIYIEMHCLDCEQIFKLKLTKKDVIYSEMRPEASQITWASNCPDCGCPVTFKTNAHPDAAKKYENLQKTSNDEDYHD